MDGPNTLVKYNPLSNVSSAEVRVKRCDAGSRLGVIKGNERRVKCCDTGSRLGVTKGKCGERQPWQVSCSPEGRRVEWVPIAITRLYTGQALCQGLKMSGNSERTT